MDEESLDLVGIVVSIVLELIRVELVVELLWHVNNDVAEYE